MSIFSGLEEIVKEDWPLGSMTWYGIGGNADYFITPKTVDQLSEVVRRCSENEVPLRVLGFGSNLLISDEGVRGVVIKLESGEFTETRFEGDEVVAFAGANLSKLVLDCVRQGLGGIETITGIPGSVGGAIKMNAGGTFGDIGSSVESVTLMDSEGKLFEKNKPELAFGYRSVNVTSKVIVSTKLKLVEADREQLLRTVKEIWIYKKNSQPLSSKNAGCVFKNERGISAGALIDRAGLKGLKIGGAKVSEKHANFILTEKDCTSSDVKRLIDAIGERVKERSDINLELELEIW